MQKTKQNALEGEDLESVLSGAETPNGVIGDMNIIAQNGGDCK